jgi:hypothetical protein
MNQSNLNWRWDQGRLEYFQFDNIKRIAKSLVKLEGVQLDQSDSDPLREMLQAETGLPLEHLSMTSWQSVQIATGVFMLIIEYG